MPTPKGGYYIGKEKIPSTTQIIGRFKDSGGLIRWAYKQGLEGVPLYGDGSQSKLACDVGTCAHDRVESWIRGRKFDEDDYPDDILDKSEKAFEAFLRWTAQCNLKADKNKTEIFLVSHKHRFGGTPDAVNVEAKRRVFDWKNSNSVYSDYLLQLAAYGILWDENNPDDPVTGYDLVRFSKETGDFAHYSFEDLSMERKQFLLYREAYELDLKIRKRV